MTVAAAMFGSVHALGAVAVLAVAAPASASEPLLVRSSLPTTDALFGQVIATRAEEISSNLWLQRHHLMEHAASPSL